jgi:plasmid stability protein
MATITVKNIPDELYARLKAAAVGNRRSINNEIISRIEKSLSPRRTTTEALLARIRRFHEELPGPLLTIEQIREARDDGRL